MYGDLINDILIGFIPALVPLMCVVVCFSFIRSILFDK